MWVAFAVQKLLTFFSKINIRILYIESAKTVNEMTLNELVKLTTLWTTGPRSTHFAQLGLISDLISFLKFQNGISGNRGPDNINYDELRGDLWRRYTALTPTEWRQNDSKRNRTCLKLSIRTNGIIASSWLLMECKWANISDLNNSISIWNITMVFSYKIQQTFF